MNTETQDQSPEETPAQSTSSATASPKAGKSKIVLIGIPIAIIIIIVAILALKNSTGNVVVDYPLPPPKYEITEIDTFSDFKSVKAEEISVKGVQLGENVDDVIKKLGSPDKQTAANSECINMEYGKKFGLFDTGLILHVCNDKVLKMTFKQSFNPLLKGKTKIIHTKEDIYRLFGKPDETVFIPLTSTSAVALRVIEYQTQGIEFLVRKNDQDGFVITNAFESALQKADKKQVNINPTATT